jgi:acetyl-CoA C-acetyltransferase
VVGGFENMSRIPYYLSRDQLKEETPKPTNGLFADGLTDSYGNGLMGVCAEKTATELNISREE